jgi:poly(beta-D-mannuronate) lyase
VPPAVTDLALEPTYRASDPSQSHVDLKRAAAYKQQTANLRTFLDGANRMADLYVATLPRNAAPAQCLAEWLVNWAREGALLGSGATKQGNAERKWMLAALSLDYALLADAPEIADRRREIEGWLRAVARVWLTDPDFASSRPNNHLNWAALALLAVGAAADDRDIFQRGLTYARSALTEIEPDGSLPHELTRGAKAVRYLVFAAEPLVVAAEIAAANGLDLYAEQRGALHRLVRFTRDAMLDPDRIRERTGAKQDWRGRGTRQPYAAAWGWLRSYNDRFPDPETTRVLKALEQEDFRQVWLGDMKIRFGSSNSP